jgi:hypothetical protein
VERDFMWAEVGISEDRRTIEVVDPGSSEYARGSRTLVWTDAFDRPPGGDDQSDTR